MDRQIVYAGSIPLDTDLLQIQRNTQAAVAVLTQIVLGSGPVVDGITCVPGAGSYSVSLGPGSLTMLLAADGGGFGSLAADPTQQVRSGQLVGSSTVQLGGPGDVDHVVCWLVQATVTEYDAGPLALPYWNAADPSVPFTGPGNSGHAQNTQRLLRVALSAKPNAPQVWPIGTPPEPDPGWVGLYSVTTFFNKPAVEATDIAVFHGAPRLRYPLPSLPPAYTVQELHRDSLIWYAPDCVRWARIRLAGGGGGGGGGNSTVSGGGGGSGGYAETIVRVEPRQSYNVVIGAGGGGSGPGLNGVAGGVTSFGDGIAMATGGQGGASANPDSHGGQPGVGSLAQVCMFGGYGTDGSSIALVPAGNGGASAFGGGGRGAENGGSFAVGLAPGSGGGGSYGQESSGGSGASGIVIIEY